MYNTLKTELVFEESFDNIDALELKLFDYVNWYNNVRLHGSLGYLTPTEYKTLIQLYFAGVRVVKVGEHFFRSKKRSEKNFLLLLTTLGYRIYLKIKSSSENCQISVDDSRFQKSKNKIKPFKKFFLKPLRGFR
jgi:hypothetical protein